MYVFPDVFLISQCHGQQYFFKKIGSPRPLLRLFSVFSLQQINVKKVHRVSGATIRTHNLLITSLLPYPLDQDSSPYNSIWWAFEVSRRLSNSWVLELFSRRRWPTGSVQQSNMNGMMPCMGCIIFEGFTKTQQLTTWAIQPSSPTAKALQVWVLHSKSVTRACTQA